MAKRGRPVQGSKLVDNLEGSAGAKERLRIIMQTVSGELSVQDACSQLGIGATAFHKLRSRALSSALADLEPKKAGRPPKPGLDPEHASLESRYFELRKELEASWLREELALLMPHVLIENQSKKKQKEKKKKKKSRRKQHGKRI